MLWALAGALVGSLVAKADESVLAVVAALALLGAIGRRSSGQPVMSRQRLRRVAIGVATILAVLAVWAVVGAGGSR